MGAVTAVREIDVGADIREVWKVVTDTDRMGRAMGFDKIEVKPLEGAGAARHLIVTKLAGLLLEYEERPFEWVEPERFSSLRVCRRGPLKRVATSWQLTPREGGGTHVRLEIGLEPSLAIMTPLARLAAGKSAQSHLEELVAADERLRAGRERFALPPLHAAAGPALERAAAALRRSAGARLGGIVDALVALVREGADPDVGRLRPFELAERWGADRRDVVSVCLMGVSAGLLDLSWDLVCPSCRTSTDRLAELSAVVEPGHCQLCELSFGVDLDRAIEATFRPAPAVRVVEDAPLCISGPVRTPHVVAQKLVPAEGEVTLPAPRTPGRYRLFVRGGATASVDVEQGGPGEARVTVQGGAVEPAAVDVAPGGGVVVARRGGEGESHVKLERVEWASQATTAHYLGTMPAFRRQFSGQILRRGITLKVARATVLFTDLTASTALYASEGDAAAFRLVQDHFEALAGVIEAHRGAMVKTIGDAIMAVFDDDADGVRAAVAMQRAFEAFRAEKELARRRGVLLRVGVHAGPCYVVTANKILDYFGQSVNVAARLQGKAEGGEVVLAEGLADAAEAGGWLGAGARVAERFVTPIKGLDEPIRAARVTLVV
jgi:class 3 adenylate cyclase